MENPGQKPETEQGQMTNEGRNPNGKPGTELHDLKRSHYSGVWHSAEGIAASRSAPRNDREAGLVP
jgi:hypothetical protein